MPVERPAAHLRLFAGADPALLAACTANCERRLVPPGTRLLRRGQANDITYLLLSGRLGVYLEADQPPLVEITPGDCVGEMSVLTGSTASADVMAEDEALVLAMPREVLWRLVDQSHAVARNLLHLLADRVRHDDDVIRGHLRTRRALEREALVDTLTGLHNRRWMEEAFRGEIERSFATGRPATLLLVDADHFKRFNDRHGHLAGDRLLQTVARVMTEGLAPGHLAARFGGEEFVLMLGDTDVPSAMRVADAVRQRVAAAGIAADDGRPLGGVTVSIGVAGLQATDTLESLLAAADAALYRAKRAGRNRVAG